MHERLSDVTRPYAAWLKHYEDRCAARLAMQTEALDKEAHINNDRFVSLVDGHMDDIIEKAFVKLWSQS